MEHGAVANPQPRGGIWGVKDCSDLVHHEMTDERRVMPLGGDGEDLPDLGERSRVPELYVAHEGFHRRQSGVACGRPATSFHFEVGQEGQDELSIEVFE